MIIDTSNAETRQEKVKIITDTLEKGIKDLFDSAKYKDYLSKMSKLHNYSFNNSMLILLQMPDATMVASITAWNKDFHRYVNKGEHGIMILAPCNYKKPTARPLFDKDGNPEKDENGSPLYTVEYSDVRTYKPAYVYDVSQTNGEPVPRLGEDELEGKVDNYDKIMAALKAVATVDIAYEVITTGAKGYYSSAEKRIVLNDGMSDLQTIKTLIHETAHSMLHDKDYLESTGEKKDRQTREVEAESVAFTVCSYLGLDTSDYSFGYIGGWAGSRQLDAVKESMETIRKCSSEIISAIEQQLHPSIHAEHSIAQKADRPQSIAV